VQGLEVSLRDRRELYPFAEYAEEFWHYYSRKVDDSVLYDRILELLDKSPDMTSMYWPLPDRYLVYGPEREGNCGFQKRGGKAINSSQPPPLQLDRRSKTHN